MKAINELGNRYGRWLVLSRSSNTCHKQCAWLCRCDCGTEKIVIGMNLRRGISKSCGCSYTLPRGVAAHNHVIFQTKRSADDRGLEFSISKRYLSLLHKKNCFYCGSEPATTTKRSAASYNGEYTYNGIDRIDNKKGYTEGNVITCCSVCNFMKGIMDSKEFIAMANKITGNQKQRS